MKKILMTLLVLLIGTNWVYAKEKVEFVKCVDGDTFRVLINGEEHLVRMIAVDTPELAKNGNKAEYYAEDAKEYTCNKIMNARKLELEYDPKSDKIDKYDRVLAWVYVDGKLLQEELVKNGYAKVAYLYDDYMYTSILQEKQELASAKEIGVWNSKEKQQYEDGEVSDDYDEASNGVVAIIGIVILVIVFVCDKILNRKR